jgi:5-methyltetrahydropteroyltriglutamate--homocysteine methyltransferase
MVRSAILGYPRIGPARELKRALERFWASREDERPLLKKASDIRVMHWREQKAAGIDFIPSGDFSLYDHVLDTAVMLGAIPSRYLPAGGSLTPAGYFAMARGSQENGRDLPAMEMTKWFDTNYHYIVPEIASNQGFRLSSTKPMDHYQEAAGLGIGTRPVLLGPVTFLSLAKTADAAANPLSQLDAALEVYEEVLRRLSSFGAQWVQVDEPLLVMDLSDAGKQAMMRAYQRLARASAARLMLTSYFGELGGNLDLALSLPVPGVHIDLVRGHGQLDAILQKMPKDLTLSLGLVDGRNIWKTDLVKAIDQAEKCTTALGPERVIVAPSCSLMHCPEDLTLETGLDKELVGWMSFAKQKLAEVAVIARALNQGRGSVSAELEESRRVRDARAGSARTVNRRVRERLSSVTPAMTQRASPYADRKKSQDTSLGLPLLPTTTIGSFPQTAQVREMRAAFRSGEETKERYERFIREEIQRAVRFQESVGLDVLVHGEFERNDMVEYFGEFLSGFAFTRNGWVQSYGSRCVKPPVIYGDVERPHPMTVRWSAFAQSLTSRPMKGMLTGPVTILQWSFVRDDQPRSETCAQIALAIRDEVRDLEQAGISAIQIDEPALREGLPLRRSDWDEYLAWAVRAFRIASSGVRDETQIHTHMCYSEFNEILPAIAEMDADVISMESARSGMDLLGAFGKFHYPHAIGPGVYDIHSPRVPSTEEMRRLLEKAMEVLDPEQLWVNPDCGLKTRQWEETEPSLAAMVEAARGLRTRLSKKGR